MQDFSIRDKSALLMNNFRTFSSGEIKGSSIVNRLRPTPFWDESIREYVFKFSEEHPDASLEDLLYYLPEEYHKDGKMFKLQYEFGNIFSDTDVRYFLGFHDAGKNTHNVETLKAMLRLICQKYFKVLFDDRYKENKDKYYPGNLEDLTRDKYFSIF